MSQPDKSDILTVRECNTCGARKWPNAAYVTCECAEPTTRHIERTYVAVDALLSDEAIKYARQALAAHSTTRNMAKAALHAAIEHATTGEEPSS